MNPQSSWWKYFWYRHSRVFIFSLDHETGLLFNSPSTSGAHSMGLWQMNISHSGFRYMRSCTQTFRAWHSWNFRFLCPTSSEPNIDISVIRIGPRPTGDGRKRAEVKKRRNLSMGIMLCCTRMMSEQTRSQTITGPEGIMIGASFFPVRLKLLHIIDFNISGHQISKYFWVQIQTMNSTSPRVTFMIKIKEVDLKTVLPPM